MDSIQVKDFEVTILNFVSGYDLPMEVKRLALKEIYDQVSTLANTEMLEQAKSREEKESK